MKHYRMRRAFLASTVLAALLVPAGVFLHARSTATQTTLPPLIIGVATAGDRSASIRVAQPEGAANITTYTVDAVPLYGGTTVTASVSSAPEVTISGLTNGTVYQLRVSPTGGTGAGASPLSNMVVPNATPVAALDSTVTYVLPSWEGVFSGSGTVSGNVTPVSFSQMVTRLRGEIGEGPKAKIGLSVFMGLTMSNYTEDRAAIRQSLGGTMQLLDAAITRARPHNLPIGISLITAIRERTDGVETAAAAEDWRNLQWYADGTFTTQTLARGSDGLGAWATFSQYARKMRRVKELYVREFGALVKERMRQDPGILVAVTGDGEIEMTYDRFRSTSSPGVATRSWGDYSPFTVLEFRDWLRGKGLYATGERLAGEGYFLASRYSGEDVAALARFNADFGTSFATWDLKHHNWSLSDSETAGAIRAVPTVCLNGLLLANGYCVTTGGFDAPRPDPATVLSNTDRFWGAFRLFREQMVQRYNRDFARWVTEGPVDAGVYAGGVPYDRWYSAQVPTDVLFGSPAADGGVRLLTSGSPYWTADVWPYGGMGVTGYNANAHGGPLDSGQNGNAGGYYDRTVVTVAPLVVDRLTSMGRLPRWSIVEWNPSDPFSSCANIYRADNEVIRQYRPSLLMPYKIDTSGEQQQRVFDSGFVTGLKELMTGAAASAAPLNCTTPNLPQTVPQREVQGIGKTGDRAGWAPIITWAPPAPILAGTALSATQLNATANVPGRFAYTTASGAALGATPAAGTHTLTATFTPTDTDYSVTTATQSIQVLAATGFIRGTVTNEVTGAALAGVTVSAEDFAATYNGAQAATPASTATTAPDGTYVLGPLQYRNYLVRFASTGFVEEVFSAQECHIVFPTRVGCQGAQAVEVSQTQSSRTGIDASLKRVGRLQGTLRTTAGVAVAGNIDVFTPHQRAILTTTADASGSFAMENLYPGEHIVVIGGSTIGDRVMIRAGETATVALTRPGVLSITGTVTGPGPVPVVGAVVGVYNSSSQLVGQSTTISGGSYDVRGLATGDYYVKTISNPSNLANQIYLNKPCEGCSVFGGTLVPAGSANINFTLSAGGAISGAVTSAGGQSAAGTLVQVLNDAGTVVASTTVQRATYQVDGLSTGSYYVRTSNTTGLVDQIYREGGFLVECLACGVSSGSLVSVTTGVTTDGVDFILSSGGTISGTVRGAGNTLGLVDVQVFNAGNVLVRTARTNDGGEYRATGLPSATYYVRTRNNRGFNDELYDDNGCVTCNPNEGVGVVVTAPNTRVPPVDFDLVAGGWVVGTVTNSTGAAVASARVSIFTQVGNVEVGSGTTGTNGTYRTSTVPAGSYYARVEAGDTYLGQFFCTTPGSCSAAPGVAFGVQNGSEATGINFTLPTGGRISGTLTGDGQPFEGAVVEVFDVRGRQVATGTTRFRGLYITTPGLPTGDYFVRTSNAGVFLNERYDDLPGTGDPTGGKRVGVTTGQTTPNINFALTQGGRISGAVSRSPSGAIASGQVRIFDGAGSLVMTVPVQNGVYVTEQSLRPGEYFAIAEAPNFLPGVFSTGNCVNCSPLSGTVITVSPGATRADVNFTLSSGGGIAGQVMRGRDPQAKVTVEIYDTAGRFVRSEITDANGMYATTAGLAPANYRLRTRNTQGLIDERYPDTACGACDMSLGATVTVVAGRTETASFLLDAGPQISGIVSRTSDGSRLGGVNVTILTGAGFVATTTTNEVGEYRSGAGLPAGAYFVRTSNALGLIDEVHRNIECAPCDPTKGTAVDVGTAPVTDIDFSLASAGGSISGLVRSTETGSPAVAGLRMTLYSSAGAIVAHTYTDAEGAYRFTGLRAGRFYVGAATKMSASEMISKPYLGEFYDDRPGSSSIYLATPIVVTDGAAVTGRDFGVELGVAVVVRMSIEKSISFSSTSNLETFKTQYFNELKAAIGIAKSRVKYTLVSTPTSSGTRSSAQAVVEFTANPGEVTRLALDTPACTVPTFSTTALADAKAGVAYSRTVSATGSGALTYSVSGGTFLPSGLSINATTGAITGTPSTSGTAQFALAASDASGCTATQEFFLSVAAGDPVNGTTSPRAFRFAALKAGSGGALTSVTAAQPVSVTFTSGSPDWAVAVDQPWVSVSSSGSFGAGSFTVSIVNPANVIAGSTSLTATISITGTGIQNGPLTIPVTLTVDQTNGTSATLPFGQVDTPSQNATGVQGAIGVTGWVLDNVGVTGVKIYRNCLSFDNPASCQNQLGFNVVEVGDAAFLAGARPDVEAAFSTFPQNNRAGWGYLMLTSMLPQVTTEQQYGGQGPLTLYAIATDVEGNKKLLGRSSDPASPQFAVPTQMTMANATIAKPFGAIDTPGQGQTVSGLLNNFGWALTPDSNTTGGEVGDILIPTNGSTMTVFIDSLPVALVAYNQCRGNVGNPVPPTLLCNDDVSNIFGNPAPLAVLTSRTVNNTLFRNLDAGRAPIGVYSFNTATLSNGLHTIAWSVTDSAGRTEGIGSRFFNVLNSGADPALVGADAETLARADAALRAKPAEVRGPAWALRGFAPGANGVWARGGFDPSTEWTDLPVDETGQRVVEIDEAGRLELWLGAPVDAGYLVANGTLRDLPVGASVQGARVTWAPPAGYVGTYVLALVRGSERVEITVRIGGR